MKSIVRVWIIAAVGLIFLGVVSWGVLYLVSHGGGAAPKGPSFPMAGPPYAGSTVVPPHRTFPAVKNVRWRAMPEDVVGVHVAPDHRVWTHLRSDEPLSEAAFKSMIEREYANPDPQFSGGLMLLAEPPTHDIPHGRVWFELAHPPDPMNQGNSSTLDKGCVLLGYSGVAGSWVERRAGEYWEFGNPQIFSWWNTCITRDARRRHSVALAGRAFFVHGGDVECFNGSMWTSKTIGRGSDNRRPVELMPEPDGKGIVVLRPEQIVPEHVWRWRDGNWKDVTLPEPVEWHIRDFPPTIGDGGMWICSRDGLWFSPFDGTAHPVASRTMGDFQWQSWAIVDTDERGRIYVRSEVIWNVNEPQPPPRVQALLDEEKRLFDHRAPYMIQRPADAKITQASAGGVIVRETDGSCHFSPGDTDQPVGRQAQLPDQRFSVIDVDGRTLYAGWNTGACNLCPAPPLMIFNPDAPDNIVRLDHSPNLDLDITTAGFVVDDAGGIIAQKFQGDIVRFDGKSWLSIEGLHDVGALAFASGHDGVLVVLAADNTFRLISPKSTATYASFEDLVARNRDLIAAAFSGIQLTGHECMNLSIAVDPDKDIWVCCAQAGIAEVLVGNSWQRVMKVSPSDIATMAASSSRVYAARIGPSPNDAQGFLAQVRNGGVSHSAAPEIALGSRPRALADEGPLNAADGSLWISEAKNARVVGAVRIDPTGAFTRFADMIPRCADAGGAVFLSEPASSNSASRRMCIWQGGTTPIPLPSSGIGWGAGWFAPPPVMFAGDPGSDWLFTRGGLQRLRGEGRPMTFRLDAPLYVVDGAQRYKREYTVGWEGLSIQDYNAAALSKLGYFIMARNDRSLSGESVATPGFSLRLVPVPKIATSQPTTATQLR